MKNLDKIEKLKSLKKTVVLFRKFVAIIKNIQT